MKEWLRRLMPRIVRPHRIVAGRLRGFRIVTSWHDYPGAILGTTERALLDWFEQNVCERETWLDVGAHYGYTALALSRLVGPSGRVFAFEPVAATAGYLGRTRSLNGLMQLTVIPCGLGSPESVALRQFPTVRGMADNTLGSDGRWTEAFLVARLDWLWSTIAGGNRRIDGVKIDVQGMEIEAVSGMCNLLREFRPKLVIEVHGGVDRGLLVDVLEASGYSHDALPIEAAPGESKAQYLDDRSYSFQASVHQVSPR